MKLYVRAAVELDGPDGLRVEGITSSIARGARVERVDLTLALRLVANELSDIADRIDREAYAARRLAKAGGAR